MFWILRRSRLTNCAVSFFNSINNNGMSTGSAATGYNKLCCSEENDNKVTNCEKKSSLDHICDIGDLESDTSSCSELELEEDFSQDSDYEENLTCNVCDRFFCTQHQLSQHQQKKRHFGCSSCDSLFPSLMALEHHKEEFEHWSGDEGGQEITVSDDSDQDSSSRQEMERLL